MIEDQICSNNLFKVKYFANVLPLSNTEVVS
jgi:hypothetical protein